ncbi:MAG: hypothetical protein IJW51_03505 [Clostridia bacterium]|nr:hypothetical protein [Clostridia bacterium]
MSRIIKSRSVRILLVMVLILCLAWGTYGFILFAWPTLKYRPINTEVLLPEPETVAFCRNGQVFALTEAAQATLHKTLLEWLDNVQECEHINVEDFKQRSAPRFVLRYSRACKYVGSLGTEKPISEKAFMFSNIAVFFGDEYGKIYLDFALDGEYGALEGRVAVLTIDRDVYNYGLIARAMMDTPVANPSGDLAVGEAFPARPDSVVVRYGDRLIELSAEQLDTVYAQLTSQPNERFDRSYGLFCYSEEADMLTNRLCVELRYHKRQQYLPTEIPEKKDSLRSREDVFGGITYDALLFVTGRNPSISLMDIMCYVNGKYSTQFDPYSWHIPDTLVPYLLTLFEETSG